MFDCQTVRNTLQMFFAFGSYLREQNLRKQRVPATCCLKKAAPAGSVFLLLTEHLMQYIKKISNIVSVLGLCCHVFTPLGAYACKYFPLSAFSSFICGVTFVFSLNLDGCTSCEYSSLT